MPKTIARKDMNMQKVLITGATGFVGSHALEALQAKESVELIAACRDESKLLPDFHGEVREGDVRDEFYLSSLFGDVHTLVNAFAWTSAWGHAKQSEELFYRQSLRLIDHALAQGVKKIINISSTSAAAPDQSADPMSRGIVRGRWPHMDNVVRIEDFLRQKANHELTVINLRLGIFAGRRYALGMLPILLPRLKTHLVPWMAGGRTSCPITDGRDIGRAITLAVANNRLAGYESFNIVGSEVPTVRQVIQFIHEEFGYPMPHFGVPFFMAYPFARLMELLDPLVPWEPLVTRSIVHLLEEVSADNQRAQQYLDYVPKYHWQEAVRAQIAEMDSHQKSPMPLAKPVD
jgi:nucleoside-diphosphate-sugar epimerase